MRLVVDRKGNLIKVPLRNLARDTGSAVQFRAQRIHYNRAQYIGYSLNLGNLPLIEMADEMGNRGEECTSGREEVTIPQQ